MIVFKIWEMILIFGGHIDIVGNLYEINEGETILILKDLVLKILFR